MSLSVTVRDYLSQLRIKFLLTPRARAYWEPLADAVDALVQRFVFTVRQGTISQCADDVLDHHAANKNDKRAPRETHAALRLYLRTRLWEAKKRAGTTEGMVEQIMRIPGVTNVEVITEIALRKAGFTGAFGGYNFFFIIVFGNPFAADAPIWAFDGDWGGGGIWGGPTAAEEQAELRRIIRQWKPAGHSCRFVIFAGAGFSYDGTGTGLHGTYNLMQCWESWEDGESSFARTPFYNTSHMVA